MFYRDLGLKCFSLIRMIGRLQLFFETAADLGVSLFNNGLLNWLESVL